MCISCAASVAETGPKDDRVQSVWRDHGYDSANVQYLADSSAGCSSARSFHKQRSDTSYESVPRINIWTSPHVVRQQMTTALAKWRSVRALAVMGGGWLFALTQWRQYRRIYRTDLATGQGMRLTNTPAIETAPSFNPDGSQIGIVRSDRSAQLALCRCPQMAATATHFLWKWSIWDAPDVVTRAVI
jgi:TolB protein